MTGFTVRPNRFAKTTGYAEPRTPLESARRLTAVLKVSEDGYVPDNVDVRARIDGTMFTAEFPADVLKRLEADKRVISVSIAEKMDIVE